jgi:hypothetical protein
MIRIILLNYKYIILIVTILLLLTNCKDEIISPPPPPEPPLYTKVLKGKVILENQTENSNALVYLDSLNRGVGTDSSGNYTLIFSEEDSIYNGIFKIFYFVNEFEMDTAQYVLVNGKVKLDSLDVDSEGNLPTKELEQLLLIEGWTDRQEYRTGDTLHFTARFTNVTNRTVHVFIYSIFSVLGYVSLYNEKYPAIWLNLCVISNLDADLYISPNDFYEGIVAYIIPESDYCNVNNPPLLPDDYIVVTDLFIESRLFDVQNKFNRYVWEEWYKLDRGKTPKLDWFPNKYKFPHVKIIQ